jgi:Fe-S oxidoreductase
VKAPIIVTTCPHCFHTVANEYPQFGGNFVVKHHAEFIAELMRQGKLKLNPDGNQTVAYHDPCYLGRHNGVYEAPRATIRAGARLVEPPRTGKNSFCCGAGGAQFWKEEEKGKERVSTNRYRELKETGAAAVATACPFCMRMMLEEAQKEEPEQAMEVLDIAEIVARRLPT